MQCCDSLSRRGVTCTTPHCLSVQLGQEAQAMAIHVTSAFAAAQSAEADSRGDEGNAPADSAANSKLHSHSHGWGRLKKVKLAAKAQGSQEAGTKRRRSIPEGACL